MQAELLKATSCGRTLNTSRRELPIRCSDEEKDKGREICKTKERDGQQIPK